MKKHDNENERKLIITDDGSHSLFVPALNETYHSFHGALQESRHVFIKMGLAYKTGVEKKQNIKIFELGFGTGLNALLTAQFAMAHQQNVSFTSIEAFPLDDSLVKALNYASLLDQPDAIKWFKKMHDTTWNSQEEIHEYFALKKVHAKFEDYIPEQGAFDVIYFDAFAPSKQAELWDLKILEKVAEAMAPNGIFVTYCAKGQLKRNLQTLGLSVETLSGPPGKKEMVRAKKNK